MRIFVKNSYRRGHRSLLPAFDFVQTAIAKAFGRGVEPKDVFVQAHEYDPREASDNMPCMLVEIVADELDQRVRDHYEITKEIADALKEHKRGAASEQQNSSVVVNIALKHMCSEQFTL